MKICYFYEASIGCSRNRNKTKIMIFKTKYNRCDNE